MKNQTFEDNSSILVKKSINRSKKNYIYDDNTILNKINKITNNNIYKHYSMSDLQECFFYQIKEILFIILQEKLFQISIKKIMIFTFPKTTTQH